MSKSTSIESFEQWKKIWNQHPEDEIRTSLLHHGLPAEIDRAKLKHKALPRLGADDKVFVDVIQSVSFYLEVANDAQNEFSNPVNRKALVMLLEYFFKNEDIFFSEYNDFSLWDKLNADVKILEMTSMLFCKLEFYHGKKCHVEIISKFLLTFFEYSLLCVRTKHMTEKNRILDDTKIGLLKPMWHMQVLDQVAGVYRTSKKIPCKQVRGEILRISLQLDYVERIHVNQEKLPWPLSKSQYRFICWFDERPKTLREALFRGSRVASILVELNAIVVGLKSLDRRVKQKESELRFEIKEQEGKDAQLQLEQAQKEVDRLKS